jgi:hypothetical protein
LRRTGSGSALLPPASHEAARRPLQRSAAVPASWEAHQFLPLTPT